MGSRLITSYPQPGKRRSVDVLTAFSLGCGGQVATTLELLPGVAAFYGILGGVDRLIRTVITEGREFYVGDNAYFDRSRGKFFRFARSELQCSRLAPPDYTRLHTLGVKVSPWRAGGRHVVVVEQSQAYLALAGAGTNWMDRTVDRLRRLTDRPIRERRWQRAKDKASATLAADLEGAWALVTHMSGAATEALLAGVPVFCTGPCAATPLASGSLYNIEAPTYPDNRQEWAAGLAARQWTLEELRNGTAWRALGG